MHERLKELGYTTYEQYLSSEYWKSFRTRYFKSKRPKTCMVCKEPNFDVELHHTTYDRLGCEKLTDLVPLCREHHELVHQYLDARCLGKVEDTGRVVRALTRKNGKRKITGSKRTNRHIPDNKRGTGRKNTGYTPETEPLSDN